MANTGEYGDELGISPFAGHKAYLPRKSVFMGSFHYSGKTVKLSPRQAFCGLSLN